METETIKFRSFDGYSLEGTLNRSKNEKGALLFVHGITSSRDELNFHSDYADFLSENGISSLRFDYRYHGVNETSLENLSLCGILNDIEAAYIALKSSVGSEVKSFFIVGTSFGGGLSAYWLDYNKRSEIKKLILNAPVLNYMDDVLERNNLAFNGVLSEKAQEELNTNGFINSTDIHFGRGLINELKYIDCINAVQKLDNKVVIFHGDKDDDVPLSSSINNKANSTDLEIIKGVGHGFGVEDDEDLDFPETKAIHRSIYEKAFQIILNSL